MRKVTIKTPGGLTLRFVSDAALTGQELRAHIRLAMTLDDECGGSTIPEEELARRIAAKGYHPRTGKPLH